MRSYARLRTELRRNKWLTILHCRSEAEAKFLVVGQLCDGVAEENGLMENETHFQSNKDFKISCSDVKRMIVS